MSWRRFKSLVASDLYRHSGVIGARMFWRHFCWTPGFRYTFALRLYGFARAQGWARFGFRQFVSVMLHRYSIRYGISISPDTIIGSGFYIGHFGGIVINQNVVIGNNCNISQDVTLGQINRGARTGCPVIGDNVYIGPGAKIIGGIRVGDHAAIGANAVVVDDVPPATAVGGIPARVLSDKGSDGYVNRTDYPPVSPT
jgi:serine O-acetyltransferase